MATFEIKLACPGCCGSGGFQIQCRDRAGSAQLVGFPEYVDPTSPPRLYRKKEYTGSMASQDGSQFPTCCETLKSVAFSGSNQYNRFTAVLTVGGQYRFIVSCPAGSSSDTTVTNFNGLVTNAVPESTITDHAKTTFKARWGTPGTPCDSPFSPGPGVGPCASAVWQHSCDEGIETLTDEDTEEDAMVRAEASAGAWSAWGAGGCCTSKSPRGSGVSNFTYRQSQYRIRPLGKPGAIINVEITFSRSFYDGSSGSNYTEIRQFIAQKEKYAAGDDADYQVFGVVAPAGGVTCMAGAQLYVP